MKSINISKIKFSKISISLFVMLLFSNLFSYSILDNVMGNDQPLFDARSLAMGSAGIGSQINPANLASQNSKFGFQFSHEMVRSAAQRSLPMYDSFDGFVGDAEYVSNENIFNDFAFNGFYKFELNDFDLALGMQYQPIFNFDSRYDEEIRNNSNSDYDSYPPIIAENLIKSEGSINALSFSSAVRFRMFSLGIELSKLSGDQTYEEKILWSDYAVGASPNVGTLNEYAIELERDFDGLTYQIGLMGELNRYTSIGFNYTPELRIDYETSGVTFDYNKPGKYRFGLTHSPRSFIKTTINCDIEYVTWDNLSDIYENDLNYYIGIEHIINEKLPFRMGFNYQTTYQYIIDQGIEYANKIAVPTITGGTGFNINDNINIDFAISFSHRIYEALDLFQDSNYDYEFLWENYTYMNLADRGWENPDKVTESFLKLQTSISYRF